MVAAGTTAGTDRISRFCAVVAAFFTTVRWKEADHIVTVIQT